MRLTIVTPLLMVVDEEIDSLRAEDASGSFGILSGHTAFLTALVISVVSWRKAETHQFCAVRGGVLSVIDGNIAIATREAVIGQNLATLDDEVLARFRADSDVERTEHTESVRLQLNALRHMISRLQPRANSGEFR
ncbi:F0F1 ATP synthase subunit epsilon [Cobetia sp. L2A1]|uniref:F0F1 ATP synthase subunit epsilon n=1 Tax=Cobetia sp. L2A1 TaxID=2686360 RepID=UPI00131AAD04|nr:F0F1 ATP synthase subunit epsilon [Cobetia sp. L2A1]